MLYSIEAGHKNNGPVKRAMIPIYQCLPEGLSHLKVCAPPILWSGVDEAGRGPLAGPVVAAACVIPAHIQLAGVNDSKILTEADRETLYEQLTTNPEIEWAVCVARERWRGCRKH